MLLRPGFLIGRVGVSHGSTAVCSPRRGSVGKAWVCTVVGCLPVEPPAEHPPHRGPVQPTQVISATEQGEEFPGTILLHKSSALWDNFQIHMCEL